MAKNFEEQITHNLSNAERLYHSILDLDSLQKSARPLKKALKNIAKFAIRRDCKLDKSIMSHVRETLFKLCNEPRLQVGDECFSISDYDSEGQVDFVGEKRLEKFVFSQAIQDCFDITVLTEHVVLILDAKILDNVHLKKFKKLAGGHFNDVFLSRDDGQRLVLRCGDLYRPEIGFRDYNGAIVHQFLLSGYQTGTYRRILAAMALQSMLCKLGAPEVLLNVFPMIIYGKRGSNPTVGFSMQKLQKKPVTLNAEFWRLMVWLQLQDCLAGQSDRHANNVLFKGDEIRGIDHDFSFPNEKRRPSFAGTIPDSIVNMEDGFIADLYVKHNYFFPNMYAQKIQAVDNNGRRNYCMPPVIDSDMKRIILSIQEDELRKIYQNSGLTKSEIVPALKRLHALQEKIAALPPEKILNPKTGWDDLAAISTKEELFKNGVHVFNTYAVRCKYKLD